MRVALLLQGLALAFLASSLGQEDHFGIAGWPRVPNSRAAAAPPISALNSRPTKLSSGPPVGGATGAPRLLAAASAPPEWARECRPSGGGAQSAVRGSPAPLRFRLRTDIWFDQVLHPADSHRSARRSCGPSHTDRGLESAWRTRPLAISSHRRAIPIR
jgi:hypothetical protein